MCIGGLDDWRLTAVVEIGVCTFFLYRVAVAVAVAVHVAGVLLAIGSWLLGCAVCTNVKSKK